MSDKNDSKKSLVKKIGNIVVNVLCAVIMIFVLIITVSAVMSTDKPYTPILGNAYFTVLSDSMDGDYKDSFKKDAIISVKTFAEKTKDEEKRNEQLKGLKVGDIITFYSDVDLTGDGKVNSLDINSHRIIQITESTGDGSLIFTTKGDKAVKVGSNAEEYVHSDLVIGQCKGKSAFFGKIFSFMQTSAGFLIIIIVPCILLVAYCAYLVIKQILARRVVSANDVQNMMFEQAKKEALLELQKQQGLIPPDATEPLVVSQPNVTEEKTETAEKADNDENK